MTIPCFSTKKRVFYIPLNPRLFLLFVGLTFSYQLFSQTIFARANGDWDNTAVWSTIGTGGASCGCTPVAGDDVLINGYDVDIDAGTGDVTVNDIVITNARGADVRLRVQDGSVLTVSNDFEIECNSGGNDSELTIEDTGSSLNISGNFIADQDNGDDLLVDIDDNGQINISGDADFFQDGGDDMELNLNPNSGTAAQWNLTGDMTLDHDGGDDIRLLVDDASSLLTIGGDLTLNMNSGTDDDFTFNIDDGTFTVDGSVTVTRAGEYGYVDWNMDGGVFNSGDISITSSGPLFTNGAIHLELDGDAELNAGNLDVLFTGADDFYLHINENNGTEAVMNIVGNFDLTREDGDDIEIIVDDDDSELNISGDLTIVSSGGENFEIILDNTGTMTVGGDMDITINASDDTEFIMRGDGGDSPNVLVTGNFSWLSQTGNVDCELDINGGLFSVGNNFSLINGLGADDLDLDVDGSAEIRIGNDFLAEVSGGDDLRMDMGNGSGGSTAQVNIGGDASILLSDDSGPNPFWRLYIYDDTRFRVDGALTLNTDFTATALCLVDIRNTGELDVDGNITLDPIAAGELEIQLLNDSFVRIGGNFIRAARPNNFGRLDASGGNGTVEYKGTSNQLIAEDDGGGTDFFFYENLEVDNSFGTIPQLSMEGDATVNGDLTMNDGVVASNTTDILIVANDGTTSNASDDSYVDGYMRKVGDDAFTFPSGNGGFYAPISITAPGATTDRFEAQYFLTSPHDAGFDSTMIDATLDHISKVEYWKLNRTAGGSNPTVTLSWDTPRSGGVVNEADLRFARWNGSSWNDLGLAGLAGSPVTGTLDNNTGITTFTDANPYTIATIDAINPLPIELLSFSVVLNKRFATLHWETASESNTDYFEIERSTDALNWEPVGQLKAAGNSVEKLAYELLDNQPISAITYYRLVQYDFDGASETFGPLSVSFASDEILIYPNPATNYIQLSGIPSNAILVAHDAIGRVVPLNLVGEGENRIIYVGNLPNGTYFISDKHKKMAPQRFVIMH